MDLLIDDYLTSCRALGLANKTGSGDLSPGAPHPPNWRVDSTPESLIYTNPILSVL